MPRVSPVTTLDLEALERLSRNADFAVYLRHLHEKIAATQQLYPSVIAAPEDAALYNKQRGFIEGLVVAIHLCDMMLTYKET